MRRKLSVYGTLRHVQKNKATPIIGRHIDACSRYKSHLRPFTWPRDCSAGGPVMVIIVRAVHAYVFLRFVEHSDPEL
ncbi:uncharacterized protein FMAN_07627 [Fusarium mangiferae]|uniref:Uncharacterized protein n=1 Tax=Fusarium mangiferae TaxID=192010 RepID=A0A1L7T201_FUSMA|nr:uncharacterized protein FMAN_07627 [Fusarium mangiferae]CVK92780.1 uncharacterized protein FMAN_07627 [Fusarium mangiferae]